MKRLIVEICLVQYFIAIYAFLAHVVQLSNGSCSSYATRRQYIMIQIYVRICVGMLTSDRTIRLRLLLAGEGTRWVGVGGGVRGAPAV